MCETTNTNRQHCNAASGGEVIKFGFGVTVRLQY